jgi:hypothetical protein
VHHSEKNIDTLNINEKPYAV